MEKKSERTRRRMNVVVLLIAGLMVAVPTWAVPEGPTSVDSRITKQIAALLNGDHFLQQPLNDEMSHRFLGNYINAFDRTRLYFFQSDIDEFEKYDTALDDLVKRGDISFAFTVYNRFIKRLEERVSYIEKLLAADHDFTIDEFVDLDREEAPWAKNIEEIEEMWRTRIKYLLLNLKAEGETDEESVERLQKRYRNFLRRMKQMDNDELLQMHLSSLSMGYDPHTTYMSAGTLEDFNISMKLELEGIGARLQEEDGYTIVHEVLAGGAADKHGLLRADDKIIGVAQGRSDDVEAEAEDFVDVVDMKLSDTVKLIRGPKGSIVRLKVVTGIDKKQKVYTIKRAKVELTESEAHGEIFEDDFGGGMLKVGVIDLPRFYMDFEGAEKGKEGFKSTTTDVRKILDDFKLKGVEAVVLDLRKNGGGSLTEAINLTGLFIDRGPVVQIKGPVGAAQQGEDKVAGMSWEGPLVILTSRFSASASEILAGAIQDYRRGLIVGDHSTFGKGTVQHMIDIGRRFPSLTPLSYGALKLTRQMFYRPNGDSTQHRGVVSDVTLPSMTDILDVGETEMDYAIDFQSIAPSPFQRMSLVTRDGVMQLTARSVDRRSANEDFQRMMRNIAKYNEAKNNKRVPLEEEAYTAYYENSKYERSPEQIAEEEEAKAKAKAREEALAAGIDPETLNDDNEEEESPIQRDFYLDEVMAITSDYAQLKHGKLGKGLVERREPVTATP